LKSETTARQGRLEQGRSQCKAGRGRAQGRAEQGKAGKKFCRADFFAQKCIWQGFSRELHSYQAQLEYHSLTVSLNSILSVHIILQLLKFSFVSLFFYV
jgi:hypothetical protein